MSRIIFDEDTLKIMSFCETITRATLKDCIVGNGKILFITEQGHIGRAIGKKASNLRRLEKAFNRKIKIVEFNPDIIEFTSNLIHPLQADEIRIDGATLTIRAASAQVRAALIGRDSRTLKITEGLLKRYFNIDAVKVR